VRALRPLLPMLPLQILFQKLRYHISQIASLDDPDKESTEKPRKWEIGGPASYIFEYATFAGMLVLVLRVDPPPHRLVQRPASLL
jgi:hypothetical protein